MKSFYTRSQTSRIGAYICHLLEVHNLPQYKFAESINVSDNVLRRCIRVSGKYPSLLTAIKICKGLEKLTGARWDTHALNLIRIVEEETNAK